MIRRPPRSTLFPYTRSSDLTSAAAARFPKYHTASTSSCSASTFASATTWTRCGTSGIERSEEHTSELQSPCNLVCRLLLEKKKKQKKTDVKLLHDETPRVVN